MGTTPVGEGSYQMIQPRRARAVMMRQGGTLMESLLQLVCEGTVARMMCP